MLYICKFERDFERARVGSCAFIHIVQGELHSEMYSITFQNDFFFLRAKKKNIFMISAFAIR